jgi:hypothetical protein
MAIGSQGQPDGGVPGQPGPLAARWEDVGHHLADHGWLTVRPEAFQQPHERADPEIAAPDRAAAGFERFGQ